MKRSAVQIVKIAGKWHIKDKNGKLSRICTENRAAMIGWALMLGVEVIVRDDEGNIEEVIAPENRTSFHALLIFLGVSFLAMISAIVWGLIWLARKF